MMRRQARWLAFVIALLLVAQPLAAQACFCASEQEHAENEAALDKALKSYRTMGASIVFIKEGEIVDAYHFGRANRADDIPITEDTLFRIASVSKMVTAVGLLRLMEMGMFDLDADVGLYYNFPIRNPFFPNTPITIRQIMTHTASLQDDGHYKRALNGDIIRLESVFNGNYARTNFIRREPGTYVDYSNFGGGMLGSLIELFTGMTVDEWMAESVFDPLGLTASYFTPNLPEGTQIARIYNIENYGMTMDSMALTHTDYVEDCERHYTYTAGGLSISAMDLAKILMVIAGDGSAGGVQVLQPETVAMMRTLQNNVGSVTVDADRGLNLNIIQDALVNGRTLIGHQGKAYGMICAAYCDPTDQTGVVLLTNGCDDSTFNSVARVARAVMQASYEIIDRHAGD